MKEFIVASNHNRNYVLTRKGKERQRLLDQLEEAETRGEYDRIEELLKELRELEEAGMEREAE